MPETIDTPFRFQFVNSSGQPVGWRSRPGKLTPDSIQLKDVELSYNAIVDSTTRNQRLVLVLDPLEIKHDEISKHLISQQTLVLQITQAKPLQLERQIDRVSSSYLAERHRQDLIRQGQGEAFRTCVCPHCEATIDLSLLNKSPWIYCRFCESIFEDHGPVVSDGEHYRQCDECAWFDRVQSYTVFYFYFLVFFYGFSYKRRTLCDTCMDKVFWKALLINFIFILGIFPTLWMKLKGKAGRNPDFKELARGNSHGKQGNLQSAVDQYEQMYNRHPGHPGIAYNHALSLFKADDTQGGVSVLQDSLKNCSNYAPSVRLLNRLRDQASR